VTNTTAYYGTELITVLKSFIAQAHGSNDEGKKVLQQPQNEGIIFSFTFLSLTF
jgi:hypothetical protein